MPSASSPEPAEPPTADPASSMVDPTPLINEYLESPPEGVCPPVPPPALPPASEDEEQPLKLVKPENIRSRFWVHFHKYDLEFHPDKKTTARCNICGKDISVKQGTGGLKNHLKFKHPEENNALFDIDEMPLSALSTVSPRVKKEKGAPRGGGDSGFANKKPRYENAYASITMKMDAEKRTNEKHWMEMWSSTRRELRALRQELKEEDNEDTINELQMDMRVMEKKKADYAELLGYEAVSNSTNSTEDV